MKKLNPCSFNLLHPTLLLFNLSVCVWLSEIQILYCLHWMKLNNMKYLPFLKFKIFTTCSSEIPFIEVCSIWMLKITRKIGSCIREFVWFISNQQIVATSKCWTIWTKTANCLIFQWLYKRILSFVSNRKQKGFSFEVSFKMCGIFMELIFPTKWSIPPDNFIILSQAKS